MTNKTKAAIEEAAKEEYGTHIHLWAQQRDGFFAGAQHVIEHPERYDLVPTAHTAAFRERVKELESLMQEFVDRVDRGEVRSKNTYAKFKEALK